MRNKKNHVKDINYVTYLDLFFACVAAFAVGLLMSGLLLGGGLRYFGNLAKEGITAKHAQAASLVAPAAVQTIGIQQQTACGTIETTTLTSGGATRDLIGHPLAIFHDTLSGNVTIVYCSSN